MNLLAIIDELANRVEAAEQHEMPFLKDIKRDWSKWQPESWYDALYEDYEGPELSEQELSKLEAQREDHIEKMYEFLKKVIDGISESADGWLQDQAGEYFKDQNAKDYVDYLRRNGQREIRDLIDTAIGNGSEDLITDWIENHADIESNGRGIVLDQYQGNDQDEYNVRDSRDDEEFEELLEGLGEEELKEISDQINRHTHGRWEYKPYRNGKVKDLLYIDLSGKEYYYCIDRDDFKEFLEGLLGEEEEEEEEEETNLLSEPVIKQLPPGATADQLALLRMFDTEGTDTLKTDKLRKLPLAQSPWVKQLFDRNKTITPEIVMQEPTTQPTKGLTTLQANQVLDVKPFTMNLQVIWTKKGLPNQSFIVGLPADKFEAVFGGPMEPVTNSYMNNTNHPSIDKKTLTIGWVRFTVFDKDIWIDEIQTDLFGKEFYHEGEKYELMSAAQGKVLGGTNAVTRYIVEQFIREMRSRGYQRFYLPNIDIKHSMYGAEPPTGIYTDLPKKLRFHQIPYSDTPMSKLSSAPAAKKLEWALKLNDYAYAVNPPDPRDFVTLTENSNVLMVYKFPDEAFKDGFFEGPYNTTSWPVRLNSLEGIIDQVQRLYSDIDYQPGVHLKGPKFLDEIRTYLARKLGTNNVNLENIEKVLKFFADDTLIGEETDKVPSWVNSERRDSYYKSLGKNAGIPADESIWVLASTADIVEALAERL